jgi:hypothetical protein
MIDSNRTARQTKGSDPLNFLHYHCPTDQPETLDYQAMTELVRGLSEALTALDERR